jgi:7,8-dihydropterin-6-yl-methyl-4-(beta-D-ribofuranosyl)aminobenzene 5'-phosphate synthase
MNHPSRRAALAALGMLLSAGAARAAAPRARVKALKITLLSTMLADTGLGEWGFAAWVEVDGRSILFDTGAHPDLVVKNARELNIDLSKAEDVVLSHNHPDHTTGLVSARQAAMAGNPKALGRAHVSTGIFASRFDAKGQDRNLFATRRPQYEATGGAFVTHDGPAELAPGVWFTGPVPRTYPETNWGKGLTLTSASGPEDNVPEDSALVFDTAEGLVVLTGCGHAGIVNICEYARKAVEPAPLLAVIGGLHLYEKSDETVDWTAGKLKAMGLRYLLAAHCTGIEATWRLRQDLGLTRKTAAVGAVGATFILGQGIYAGGISS